MKQALVEHSKEGDLEIKTTMEAAEKRSVQLETHQVLTGWEWGKWMKLNGNEQRFIKG